MSDSARPSPEEIILYEKDPKTRIATITFNRPDRLNAPTIGARLRYARLLHRANIDDEVKVLVIRGAGNDLGSGVDLPEFMEVYAAEDDEPKLGEFGLSTEDDVRMPPPGSFRGGAQIGQWFADPRSGCRTLQDFRKISILEVKGYCYGWHFYQAADADLVISSDDALFGHAAFRYAGWGPRMWAWASTMGIRKFQEMVFTGRPFTAAEMYDCNFLNKVVPRDQLEDEVAKYALACSRTRPTDVVFQQKLFFAMMKQHQGEYMGSMLTGLFESLGNYSRPDAGDASLDEMLGQGLASAVKDNDDQFPPDFRLSRSGRRKPE
ncbi:enoyl-CoA hydratase/isomerase family protein [Actinophytocola oryzae]|uniref:Enoyl-CoA hydratase/carnithine racemase n=1 Tax=Actinophytocola oryzae TaxID=502181 RepID=A0A4R7W273_9PSEU|nr:enoyl-CoA hydratase/isomerase family protein [Actinophytocola oryzae]TDV55969.1 enoyl-CoA hydratase/carnithine racemase [Actinophytocola oryzae]